MNILVVGSGGREHAIVLKCLESEKVDQVYCAPGNGGTAEHAHNVNITVDSLPEILAFVKSSEIDLCIVGPEAPLVFGLADLLRENGCKVVFERFFFLVFCFVFLFFFWGGGRALNPVSF